MKNQFTTYEISLKLKELGFDEKCFGKYSNVQDEFVIITWDTNPFGDQIKAPLWQQVIDWFREEHEIIIIYSGMFISGVINPYYKVHTKNINGITSQTETGGYTKSIEEAREKGILKAIELIENK